MTSEIPKPKMIRKSSTYSFKDIDDIYIFIDYLKGKGHCVLEYPRYCFEIFDGPTSSSDILGGNRSSPGFLTVYADSKLERLVEDYLAGK